MHWFFIALSAPFLWAIVNISDQYLVETFSKGKRDSGGLVLFSSLMGVLVAFVISLFTTHLIEIPLQDKILLFVTGAITIAWVILYLFTLEIEDVSVAVPWFLTVPIFGYALGYIFLGETLSMKQILGSIIILCGVLIISIDFSGEKRKFKWEPAIYMLTASMLIAISGIIFKYVTIGNNFWVTSFWEYVGLGTCGVLLYLFVPKYRREFLRMNNEGGVKIFSLNMMSETVTILGNLLTNYAMLLAPVTMVYLVGSFQPAIVLFLTLLLTKFLPSIIKEDTRERVLLPKIIAVVIMTIGSAVLFL